MTKPSKGSNPVFFNTARNLIYEELFYDMTYMAYNAGPFFEQASCTKSVASCV